MDTYGKTALQYTKNKGIKALLMKQSTPSNLKCFCTRLIVTKRVNHDKLNSLRLKKFIDIHGGRFIRSDSEE